MASSVTSFSGKFDAATRDQASLTRKVSLACFGAGNAGQRHTARAELFNQPDFILSARTEDATALNVAELIALGVTFPAATIRVIVVDAYLAGNAADETGFLRSTFVVSGGTTPIVRVTTVGGPSAVAGAGFAATPVVTATAGSGTLTIAVDTAEAEIVNWVAEIKVGKLQNLILGV